MKHEPRVTISCRTWVIIFSTILFKRTLKLQLDKAIGFIHLEKRAQAHSLKGICDF